ncbi:MAG: type II secretion system F family protein [Robiginitomaculum sp.]|nr:type II secretion system F family protein [Robiginitomaculum sp.]
MQAYDYEAVNAKGKTSKGTVMATSARAARRDLRARDLTPINMHAAADKKGQKGQKTEKKVKEKVGKVKTKVLTQATRQLAILVEAGTPVSEALKVTALQFEGSPMRTSLLEVRRQILEGRRLSQAMSRDKTYSPLYCSMVASGEDSGQLGPVLTRLAGDLESAQKVRRKVLGATVYPIILSVVALGVITILMVTVVPKVVSQFDSFNQELPRLTKITIGISEWLQANGLWLVLGIALGVAVFIQAIKVRRFRLVVDRFVLKLPFIGNLNRDMNAARFARTMAGLLDSGTPVLTAMGTAKNTLRNLVMYEATDKVIEEVRGGSSVGGALKRHPVFPPLMIHMIASGEQGGDLGAMFAIAADYMESEFDSSTTIVLNLLEPAIIIFLGGVVMMIVAAIFLPILRLNTMSF